VEPYRQAQNEWPAGSASTTEEAAQAVRETLRIELADGTEWRVTEAIGQGAEAEARAAIALARTGKDPLPPIAVEATSATPFSHA
jgi:predicted 2-oxoglutarate/Fe(II)-dependent dioxygenase YbiX